MEWNTDGFLRGAFATMQRQKYKVDRSANSEFLYHGPQTQAQDIQTYDQFERVAKAVDAQASHAYENGAAPARQPTSPWAWPARAHPPTPIPSFALARLPRRSASAGRLRAARTRVASLHAHPPPITATLTDGAVWLSRVCTFRLLRSPMHQRSCST